MKSNYTLRKSLEEYYCRSCEFVLQKLMKSSYTLSVIKLVIFIPSCRDCLCFPRLCFCVKRKSPASHEYFFLRSYMDHMDISSILAQIVSVFLGLLFVSQGSHMHHMDIYFLHAKVVYVFLGLLFVTKRNYMHPMDIYSLHAHIVSVFSGFLFVSQVSHMHNMDIYFHHVQIVYVFLGIHFVTQRSYMHHTDISLLHAQIV